MFDAYSLRVSRLQMYFDQQYISEATCFFWKYRDRIFLVTNWHNLSGKNANTGENLSKTGALPNIVRFDIWIDGNTSEHGIAHLNLYENDTALWIQHPHWGRVIDVACLELPELHHQNIFPINVAKKYFLPVEVSDDVFILGYPIGIGVGRLPLWKRASIASEPSMDIDRLPKFFVDTASSSGMSGSPVLSRRRYTIQDDDKFEFGKATDFVGIYSGRVISEGRSLEAQIGIVWKSSVISEIVSGGVPGVR